jgi:UDP-galactopyranose mutase
MEGINVHKYGPHIFHTNNKPIWDYVNQFVEFNRFTFSPLANFKGEIYNLPFNMNTFYQMWGLTDPIAVKQKIIEQRRHFEFDKPRNLEEQALAMVGEDIYYKLIKGYTEKQWGREAKHLPAFIIKRLPVRFLFDNNYFNDTYQGIPVGGYNNIIEGLLDGDEVQLGEDYLENKDYWNGVSDKIVYTGAIDEMFDYIYGELEYRSLDFKTEIIDTNNFQGVAVVNYTDAETPFTRIIEHKHFEFGTGERTIITKEYPSKWTKSKEKFYPINDLRNNGIFEKYKDLARKDKKLILGGRLAEYKYYDMHQVIASAISKAKKVLI